MKSGLVFITIMLLALNCELSWGQRQTVISGMMGYQLAVPCSFAIDDANGKYRTYDGTFDGSMIGYYGGTYMDEPVSKFFLFCHGGELAAIQADFDLGAIEAAAEKGDLIVKQLIERYGDQDTEMVSGDAYDIPLHLYDTVIVSGGFILRRNGRTISVAVVSVPGKPNTAQLIVIYQDDRLSKLLQESTAEY